MLCNSLGSVKLCKPGQAASGIRSVPGHAGAGRDPGGAAGESPGGSLWLSSLWAPALLQQGCQWGTLLGGWELALAGGFYAAQLSVSSAGSKGDLCSVPSHSASRWTYPGTPCAYLLHGDVVSDWRDSSYLKIFLFHKIFCVSGHDWFH